MSHLKKYPTTADVRALVTEEWLTAKVTEFPSYNATENIFSYTGEVTPNILMSLANLFTIVRDTHPDAKMGRDFSVTRDKSVEEIENEILDREASNRYYHPDEYDEYTDEDIAE